MVFEKGIDILNDEKISKVKDVCIFQNEDEGNELKTTKKNLVRNSNVLSFEDNENNKGNLIYLGKENLSDLDEYCNSKNSKIKITLSDENKFSLKSEEFDNEEKSTCLVCFENKANAVLMECGHGGK